MLHFSRVFRCCWSCITFDKRRSIRSKGMGGRTDGLKGEFIHLLVVGHYERCCRRRHFSLFIGLWRNGWRCLMITAEEITTTTWVKSLSTSVSSRRIAATTTTTSRRPFFAHHPTRSDSHPSFFSPFHLDVCLDERRGEVIIKRRSIGQDRTGPRLMKSRLTAGALPSSHHVIRGPG